VGGCALVSNLKFVRAFNQARHSLDLRSALCCAPRRARLRSSGGAEALLLDDILVAALVGTVGLSDVSVARLASNALASAMRHLPGVGGNARAAAGLASGPDASVPSGGGGPPPPAAATALMARVAAAAFAPPPPGSDGSVSLLRFADLLLCCATADDACFAWAEGQGHLDLLVGIVQVRSGPRRA